MKGRWVIPLAALIAAGCAGPRPLTPGAARVVPPPRWLTDPGPARDPLPNWWEALQDPVLDELVDHAIANNSDIMIAAARVEEADAAFREARGGQLPSLDLSGRGIPRERTYSTVTGKGIIVSAYEVELGASYDTDLFGRLRDQTASARATLLGTKAAAAAVRIATIAGVVQGYVAVRTDDAAIAIATATLASRQKQLALVKHQDRDGATYQVSVSEASSQVHAVEQQLAQLQLQLAQQEHALSVLLGDNPEVIRRGRPLVELPFLNLPTSVPAALLRRRPDIYEAEEAVVAADRTLDAARAAFMPDLRLSATIERLGANLLPNPLSLYSFESSVLAPIFEGGKLRAAADLAAGQRDEAAFAYRKAALSAFAEVEDALSGTALLADKEKAALGQVADATSALRNARRRFATGYSAYQDVLDAERDLLSAQLTAAQAHGDRITTMVKLYQAMGGGWESPETPTNRDFTKYSALPR